MKKIIALLVALLTFAGAYLYFSDFSIDDAVKIQIMKASKKSTGLDISIGNVQTSITDGRGIISDIRIKNPEGFSNADMLSIGSVDFTIDISSITKQPYVIKNISVNNVTVAVEANENRVLNISAFENSANNTQSQSSGYNSPSSKTNPLLRIENIVLKSIDLNVDLKAMNKGAYSQEMDVLDFGSVGGVDGLRANEIATVLSAKLFKMIQKKIIDKQKNDIEKKLKEKLEKELKKQLKNLFK